MQRRRQGIPERTDSRNIPIEVPVENHRPPRAADTGASRGRRRDGSGRRIRAQECVPLPWRLLLIIINENDPDKLVLALSAKPSWTLLLESDFKLDELQAIFIGLKKCCAAQSPNLLRKFLSDTLVENQKFVTQCCVLFSNLKEGDLKLVENVFSVLEASVCLQPAGLAVPCMLLLRSLESQPLIRTWNDSSDSDLLEKIQAIGEQITAVKNASATAQASTSRPKLFKGYRTSGKAPNDFRGMTIFPTQDDLDEKNPFLRLNIVKGSYDSLDDYLDVQFRLLREDFVSPLRNGLREFKSLGGAVCRWKLRAIQDVRFYLGVVYQKPEDTKPVFGFGDCVTLLLAEDDFKRVHWERSKRFTNGSLVGISADNFDTIMFATVRNRDPEKLKTSGALTLELCFKEDSFKFKPGIGLSLIENSGAYFEAYRYNLAALQTMIEMPLSQYIVSAERSMRKPAYISSGKYYDLTPIMKESAVKESKYLVGRWPSVEDTILNVKQLEAVQSAFQNELCIIQGPPGTGKTFVGLKIVELMLRNEVTHKPLLIVCYTNHALDQFLEGISQFTQSIVRIGGRCDSKELEKFTLRNHRHEFREEVRLGQAYEQNLRHRIWLAHKEKTRFEKLKDEIEGKLALFEGRAFYQGTLESGINWSRDSELHRIDLDPARDTHENNEDDLEDEGHLSDEDRGQLEEDYGKAQTSCSSRRERVVQNQVGTYEQYLLATKDPGFLTPLTYAQYEYSRLTEWRRVQALLYVGSSPPSMSQFKPSDWWLLYRNDHWKRVAYDAGVYLHHCRYDDPANNSIFVSRETLVDLEDPKMNAVEQSIKCLHFRLEEIHTRLRQAMGQLEELENALDSEIINSVKIIGITTTGAAKYNKLLRKTNYEIVIVEEAAEVLEAHLVTCVCPSTKQMVLIGDHQQLQPNTTVHNLATNFNLQVSLFERLITNGMPYVRLQEQHRMRDEFLKLLVPAIYSDYFSHESVFEYEDIKGLSHNLFFVTHEFTENTEKENSSKSNSFEAEFVVRLALYLRMQGYTSKQIVILTTYSGQVFAIKNEIHSLDKRFNWTAMKTVIDRNGSRSRVCVKPDLPISKFDGIRVTTVDNYQGEESDIVIASFVRSNEDQKIGFLSRDNRVCVALSRAKKGFYCVGNIAMLAQASQTWRNISEVLIKGNYVNKGVELKCDVHDKRLLATKGSDFDLFSEGGCQELCGIRLPCGHRCPKTCHRVDSSHTRVACLQKCERPRRCGHPCLKTCSTPCGDCTFNVTRDLPCGHNVDTKCYTQPMVPFCEKPCERSMPCGVHPCRKQCHQRCGECLEHVDVDAACGHKVRIPCRDSNNEEMLRDACDFKVEVELLCGHKNNFECRKKTAGPLDMNLCEKATEVTCSLGHCLEVKCPIARSRKVDEHCAELTPVRMSCGHEIFRPCNQTTKLHRRSLSAECEQPVAVTLSCGHEIQVPCREKTKAFSPALCRVVLDEVLSCGHPVSRKCSEVKSCSAEVTLQSPCGHEVVTVCSRRGCDGDLLELCVSRCNKILACGHQCSGTCSSCSDLLHQPCREKCGKTSFCGHRCSSECHGQCDPCLVNEKASCPHGTKPRSCLSLIHETCAEKPRHCSHLETPCEATTCVDCNCRCETPCKKSLSCGRVKFGKYKAEKGNHSCVGLCSELCICQVCDSKKISGAMLPHGLERKDARFVRLPCNHVFEVTWLDAYMDEHKDFLRFPLCPATECGSQIRLLRRYHRVLERIRRNMLVVYTEVFGERNDMTAAYERLFKEIQRSQGKVNADFVDKVFRLRNTPSLFKLEYIRALSQILPTDTVESFKQTDTLICTDECQLQLLSDCLDLVNKKKLAAGGFPVQLPGEPMPVDEWGLCEHNHVFRKTTKECPECAPDVGALADYFAEL